MSQTIEITVPDIGNYHDVDVIEVLVQPGQQIAKDSALLTLETDKATMEVPSSRSGSCNAGSTGCSSSRPGPGGHSTCHSDASPGADQRPGQGR